MPTTTGTLTLAKLDKTWRNLLLNRSSAQINIEGATAYVLKEHLTFLHTKPDYILCSSENDEPLHQWVFHHENHKAILDLSSSTNHHLKYVWDSSIHGKFTTHTHTIPAALQATRDNTRTLKIDTLTFTHHDHQSTITFTTPTNRLFQAIIIAHLLLNPPTRNNN